MIGLDTNMLLRRLIQADTGATVAPGEPFSADTAEGPYYINHIVLAETVWVLRQKAKLSKERLVEIVDLILSATDIVVDGDEDVRTALDYFTKYPGDYTDHLIAVINRRAGCEVTVTLDKSAAKSPLFRPYSK